MLPSSDGPHVLGAVTGRRTTLLLRPSCV
jgi:hypothetical protein